MIAFDTPLNWHDAGTKSIDDDVGLQNMMRTWQANVISMAQRAKDRGWDYTEPSLDMGMSAAQITKLGKSLGIDFPVQLAWAFMQTSRWHFNWRASRQDEPRGELSSCYGGGIRETLWSAEYISELDGSVMSWVQMQADNLREDEQEAQAQQIEAFWRRHLAFHSLPNGDMLTLDMRGANPQQQAVRYFSHEQDGLHGRALAPDFFSFISRWTAIGCVGAEWWSWDAFTTDSDSEPDCSYLDPASAFAQRWVAWLDTLPAHLSGQAQLPNQAPPMVMAQSAADFALLLAAKDNELAAVQLALQRGAQINCTNEQDWQTQNQTALMHAARNGNIAMLDILLAHGASLATHVLPLSELMREAPVHAIKWLIEHGARIDPWMDDRFNSLHRLYERDDLEDTVYFELLDAMLATGCNPDIFWDTQSSCASTTLLMRCGVETAKKLLAAGANPLLRDLSGRTAMHGARDIEHVKLLCSHGLDVNDLSHAKHPHEADRPLHYKLSSWSEDAPLDSLLALLEQGADPALTDGVGRNAWWHCRHVECAWLLETKLPFDASWRNSKGGTVLHHMIDVGQRIYAHSADLLRYYADHGLDINTQDAIGNTALHAMAINYDSIHDKPSTTYLLNVGADWSIQNYQGKTPMDLIKRKHRADWK